MQTPEPESACGLSEEDWPRLREKLKRSVARVCPPWFADRREDLVQVALMRVMAILGKSEGKRELGASYLSRVAYSALVDEIRRLRRRREVPLEGEDGGGPQPPAPGPDPEQASRSRELRRRIRECLFRQVRSRRLAVTLSLQGHSVPEAARLLQWTVKKTENLVYRGLADLRHCLTAMGWQL